MATDIDILLPGIPNKTNQYEVGLTSQKQIAQTLDFQAATQCNDACPFCQSEGSSGACALDAGHIQEHQCNRVSTHRWSTVIPGPHTPTS